MTIRFRCVCGNELIVPDEEAGMIVKCPNCTAEQRVPHVRSRPDKKAKQKKNEPKTPQADQGELVGEIVDWTEEQDRAVAADQETGRVASPILWDADEHWTLDRRHEAIVMGLCAALEDEDVRVIEAATKVLGEIALPRAKGGLSALRRRKMIRRKRYADVPVEEALKRVSQGTEKKWRNDAWRFRCVPAYEDEDFWNWSPEIKGFPLYAQALEDEDFAAAIGTTRPEAAERLRKIGHIHAVGILERSLDTDDLALRGAVVRALGEFKHCGSYGRIRELLTPENMPIRASVQFALKSIETAMHTIPILIRDLSRDLKEKPPHEIVEDIQRLGRMGSPDALPFLNQLLRSNEELIRYWAIAAQAWIGDVSAAPQLLEIACDPHEREHIRVAAIRAIGELRSKKAVSKLVQIMKGGSDALRAAAVKAIGAIGDTRALPGFAKAVSFGARLFENADLAPLIPKAMNKIGEAESVAALDPYLENDDGAVRMRVVRSLGYIIGKQPIIRLIRALDDPVVGVRLEAVKSLGMQSLYTMEPA